MKLSILLAKTFLATALTLSGTWNADPAKAKVMFSVKGPFGTVHGQFSGLKAMIRFDEKNLGTSVIEASIATKTVSTGVGLRNKDLRDKEEWLNAGKFPLIIFRSKRVEKVSGGYKAIGELTIKGATKPAEIPFTFTTTATGGIFKGQMECQREDFNVGKEGGSVGKTISITLEVPVTR